jgi:hypothetical protein
MIRHLPDHMVTKFALPSINKFNYLLDSAPKMIQAMPDTFESYA